MTMLAKVPLLIQALWLLHPTRFSVPGFFVLFVGYDFFYYLRA